ILRSLLVFLFAIISDTIGITSALAIGIATVLVISTVAFITRAIVYKFTGATTYVAMPIVFIVGFLAGIGEYGIAVTSAIIMTAFLAIKEELHGFVRGLTREEILNAIKFAIVAFVIFPFLPDTTISFINPKQFWLVVVLISFLEFVTYIILKSYGENKLILTGIFGGFINSEATVQKIAEKSKDVRIENEAFVGIILANASMILNRIIIAPIVYGSLFILRNFVLPASIAIIIAILLCYKAIKTKTKLKVNIHSPFSIMFALKFALLFLFVTLIMGFVSENLSLNILYLISFIAGFIASSPVVASTALIAAKGIIDIETAGKLILIACSSATLNKFFWVRYSENKNLRKSVTIASLIISLILLIGALF
ncbi:MAG: DUF4010 domain-containing protein, partial [Candidatus Nanoarchaeia archaeon]|nr:DUF4010 domain-containing protein [Candidatus Jingweiarchaeum tengchongense]